MLPAAVCCLQAGVPALTVAAQRPEALAVLRSCAETAATGVELRVVPALVKSGPYKLGLAGEHQRENAALALALCEPVRSF